jgi:hypothetical protein
MRQVFQTAGEPPRRGSTIRANRGSTQNRRNEAVSAARTKGSIRMG